MIFVSTFSHFSLVDRLGSEIPRARVDRTPLRRISAELVPVLRAEPCCSFKRTVAVVALSDRFCHFSHLTKFARLCSAQFPREVAEALFDEGDADWSGELELAEFRKAFRRPDFLRRVDITVYLTRWEDAFF